MTTFKVWLEPQMDTLRAADCTVYYGCHALTWPDDEPDDYGLEDEEPLNGDED